jgi:hypothetical protein
MKALRTVHTKEWVNVSPENVFYIEVMPYLYTDRWRQSDLDIILHSACAEVGYPCEWVDVEVVVKSDVENPITAEEILLNTMRCTIDDDADIDVPKNFYYQHDDVLKAMHQYADKKRRRRPRQHGVIAI